MLVVQDLKKTFFRHTPNERKALQGINLQLSEGEFCTVIGSNGSGKSTLLNCIAGNFFPEKGTILINRVNVTKMPEHIRAR